MTPIEYVDSASLDSLCEKLTDAKRVAIDTEFMREKTYFPLLCLVQIATEEQIWCADPLGAKNAERFWPSLMQRSWVVHSGRQDIEVIFQTAGQMPEDPFDTQIAASLLGLAPQLGYAALVSELFGIELAKSHTRADWTRRPLAAELIEYAAEDVEYLLPAADLLAARLEASGRLDWAIEDSRALLEASLYAPDPRLAVRRMKGARYLSGRARPAARNLAAWRETEAIRRDRPRQWILNDSVLLELATAGPDSEESLLRVRGLHPEIARRAGRDLLTAIAQAGTAADAVADGTEAPTRPDERQRALLKEMQARVAACASNLDLLPEVIASKKDLSAALAGERELRVFKGWRRALIGDELFELLSSRLD
jgi:ribonuclease D